MRGEGESYCTSTVKYMAFGAKVIDEQVCVVRLSE